MGKDKKNHLLIGLSLLILGIVLGRLSNVLDLAREIGRAHV